MLNLNDKQWAYITLRLTLGINMLMHGLTRILTGVGDFADKASAEFEKGVLPVALAKVFLLLLPFIELLIGLLMVIGFKMRLALISGALLITALTFGVTSNQNWSAAGIQITYAIAFFVLLYTRENNSLCLDRQVS